MSSFDDSNAYHQSPSGIKIHLDSNTFIPFAVDEILKPFVRYHLPEFRTWWEGMSLAQRQAFIEDVQPTTFHSLAELYQTPAPQAKLWCKFSCIVPIFICPENTADFMVHNLPQFLEEMVAPDFLLGWVKDKVALLRKLLTNCPLYRGQVNPVLLASLTEDPSTVDSFCRYEEREKEITAENFFSQVETIEVTVDNAAEFNVCAISLESFEIGSTAVRCFSCGAAFQPDQLKIWVCRGNNNCPTCRENVVRGHVPAIFQTFNLTAEGKANRGSDRAQLAEFIDEQYLVREAEKNFLLQCCHCFVIALCTFTDEWSCKISGHHSDSRLMELINCENFAIKGCMFCGKPPPGGDMRKMMKCSRCLLVTYCAKECQLAHWKEHKKHCFKNAARTKPKSAGGGDTEQEVENAEDGLGEKTLSFTPSFGAYSFQSASPRHHIIVTNSSEAMLQKLKEFYSSCRNSGIMLCVQSTSIGFPVVPASKVDEFKRHKPKTDFAVVDDPDDQSSAFTMYEYDDSKPHLGRGMPPIEISSAIPPHLSGRMTAFEYALALADQLIEYYE